MQLGIKYWYHQLHEQSSEFNGTLMHNSLKAEEPTGVWIQFPGHHAGGSFKYLQILIVSKIKTIVSRFVTIPCFPNLAGCQPLHFGRQRATPCREDKIEHNIIITKDMIYYL